MKKLITTLMILTLIMNLSVSANANNLTREKEITITKVERTPNNEDFNSYIVYGEDYHPEYKTCNIDINRKLKKELKNILISRDEISFSEENDLIEKYSHSVFKATGWKLSGEQVGPVEKQVCYDSRAKGESYTKETETEITAYLKISTSIKTGVRFLVEGKLNAEAGGSYTYKWKNTTKLNGPPESSNYNTRLFYHAIDYDEYSFNVKELRYYNVYDNYGNYLHGKVEIENIPKFTVKKPIKISYSKDVKY